MVLDLLLVPVRNNDGRLVICLERLVVGSPEHILIV